MAACDGFSGPSDEGRDRFLRELLTVVSERWNPVDLKPVASPEAYAIFTDPEQEGMFRVFSTLGKFVSLDSSTTTGWRSTVATGTTITVESMVTFVNGRANVNTVLWFDGEVLKLHYLYISSPLFMELMERGAQSDAM